MERRSDSENEITKARDFLEELQKSQEAAKKSMEIAKDAMKK